MTALESRLREILGAVKYVTDVFTDPNTGERWVDVALHMGRSQLTLAGLEQIADFCGTKLLDIVSEQGGSYECTPIEYELKLRIRWQP